MPNQQNEVLIATTKKLIETFHRIATSLRFALIFIGIIGVGSGLFVTAFAGSEFVKSDDLIIIRSASFISALCLTCLSAFNVTAKGNNARNAYRYLNSAYLMHQIGKYQDEDLVKAIETAEKINGSVDFQTTTPKKPTDIKNPEEE